MAQIVHRHMYGLFFCKSKYLFIRYLSSLIMVILMSVLLS